MKEYDQIKENRSLSPWGWMIPILKMRRFSCLLRPIITTRNGWNGTNIYDGNRVVSSIKMSRSRLVNIIVPYGTKVFSKSVRSTSARFTDVKFATFNARNAVNDVEGGACKFVPNNEIGFRSGNRCGRVEERTRVTKSTRARKATRWCR